MKWLLVLHWLSLSVPPEAPVWTRAVVAEKPDWDSCAAVATEFNQGGFVANNQPYLACEMKED